MRKMLPMLGIAALVLLGAAALVAAPATECPDKVTIDDCVVKKAAVEFPHGMHAESIACTTCHHTNEGLEAGSSVEVQTCGSCHVTPEDAATPACSEMSTKKNPFHLTCITCHKEEATKNAETKAPTKCDQCHPKA